eukprot:6515601-Ditylum_brightwellii.AAC.1
MDPSKKKGQKCGLDKHWTNQCTSEETITPKKIDSGKTPWYLTPPPAGVTCLKHQEAWHKWYTDYTPPSWRHPKLGQSSSKVIATQHIPNTMKDTIGIFKTK